MAGLSCYGPAPRPVTAVIGWGGSGGRTWWAHLKFTPINIKLTILPKKIEEIFEIYDLFDRLADRSRVPDETLVPWYQQLYYQVIVAARRVKDPYTGASPYFTPHCFRHSFATALAPLIGGDAKTGAKILGHSPQTFMRYVRANDDTARAAVEKMADGLPLLGQPLSAPATVSSLRVVPGGKSSGSGGVGTSTSRHET